MNATMNSSKNLVPISSLTEGDCFRLRPGGEEYEYQGQQLDEDGDPYYAYATMIDENGNGGEPKGTTIGSWKVIKTANA